MRILSLQQTSTITPKTREAAPPSGIGAVLWLTITLYTHFPTIRAGAAAVAEQSGWQP